MKKQFFLFIAVSFISFCTYSQNNSPHLKIGAGLSLGDWASTDDGWEEDWGAGANFRAVVYSDKSRFSLSPSYIYFPVSKFNYTYSYSSTSTDIEVDPAMHYINVEGRFSFVKSPKAESYLFIGPSFLIYKESVSASNTYADVSGEDNQFKTGAITGVGFNLNLSESISIYADGGYSYIADDWDQVLITAGVLFRIF
ncbi:outer membrane beta-barrel protein [Maribellus comscasis]|uniref:Outer membrane beta-barrel protein n=1 Tax=Maribellus comscasis TaxID=2681766 RepID=A0A6I6K1S5_9BACT|nr:outer membrane beta-barrel protein [Maribellus comscasis]QGY45433.1 outer membrane beta-barrel protein [Maribellus comscasis]